MKLSIAVIVYSRLENIKTWLNCWKDCDQHGAELNIIHTGDEIELFKSLCDQHGVKYIHRKNVGLDIGSCQDVFAERLQGFNNDWEYLLWITDDVIPMSKDFLKPFIDVIVRPDVGIAAMQISQTPVTHVRTVAYCLKKEVSKQIKFVVDPIISKDQNYFYEYKGGNMTLMNQVLRMGLRCIQVLPIEKSTLWDTGYGRRLERMNEHYIVFPREPKENIIHHFYHIYADGKWQEPVAEHIRALKMGLYDQLTTFNIGIVGRRNNRNAVKQYLVEQGMYFHVIATADRGWEQQTQIPMWLFSQTNHGLILYCHTKGASDPSEVNVRWRRSMIYWNVVRWADCVEKLKECDTVGCHFIYPTISMPEHRYGNPMYAGTFYWCKAELMRTWMRPPLTHRHESEGWIGYKYVQKPWLLWDWTPYFPNTNHFADGWVNDPNFVGVDMGKMIPAVVLHDKQVPE